MFGLVCVLLLLLLLRLCEGGREVEGKGGEVEERVRFAAVETWLRALLPLGRDCLQEECVCMCREVLVCGCLVYTGAREGAVEKKE